MTVWSPSSSKPHYNDMNVLSMHALIGAYKPEGYEWVDELHPDSLPAMWITPAITSTKHFDGV